MSVSYQAETFAAIEAEVQPLWREHWLTSGVDHDKCPLNPNVEMYRQLEKIGGLHIVTVRRGGVLVGYFFSIVSKESLHYSQRESQADIYYINCEDAPMSRLSRYRSLFKFMLEEMRKLGVKKCLSGSKLHADLGPIWRQLGWRDHETVFYMRLDQGQES